MEPRIAFVTTCKGRTEHLRKTLPKNLADNVSYGNAVFVVLDYGDKEGLSGYIRTIKDPRLVYYHYPTDAPFHVSHSKNMAARCGILEGADILVTVDADNYTGKDFARFISESFREPGVVPGIFMCPNYQLIKSLPHGASRPPRGYAGRLAIWAQTFLKLGGYDEEFDTWRGEDIDMNFRLQRMGYTMRYIENGFLGAISHGAELRFREYPHAKQYENQNELEVIRARTRTVVNFGKVGCGSVYRNFSPEPIEIKPIPTRIFGIGLHKTATTSLHEALKILGFDSFHWGTGQAPIIWYEMNTLGRSAMLEQWYALSDLPIPLLYRELDKAYPGSKFILTVRDEVDWLQSVKRLWDARYNSTRWVWDMYPFSNHIHTQLYGQKDFDPLVFLARYRRHNEEVRAYFKGRSDLLIMDMDTNPGWENLCAYLGKPIPSIPYPRHGATRALGVGYGT